MKRRPGRAGHADAWSLFCMAAGLRCEAQVTGAPQGRCDNVTERGAIFCTEHLDGKRGPIARVQGETR